MLASASPSPRTEDGRFAPGHSGNPAGRPKGSKNRLAALVEALDEAEDSAIHRVVIELALAGDKTAARFCAARIDAAARREAPGLDLDLTRSEALNPFFVHARLVQAVLEGRIAPETALATIRLLGAKRVLEPYYEDDIPDADWRALQEEPAAAAPAPSPAVEASAEATGAPEADEAQPDVGAPPEQRRTEAAPAEPRACEATGPLGAPAPDPRRSSDAAAPAGGAAATPSPGAAAEPVNPLFLQATTAA
jgi:Family of unknown function (DUF5681)